MAKTPKYCHHKSTDRAFVTVNGRRIYLGRYDSPESRDAYDAEILKWRKLNDRSGKHSTTVGQLCLAFVQHADVYYRDPNGNPTGEADNFRKSLRRLVAMYRSVPCSEFGPRRLEAFQEELSRHHVRSQVNKTVMRVKAMFRWGVSKETVPAEVVTALECVKSLREGHHAALLEAAEQLEAGAALNWRTLVKWKFLPTIRDDLDRLPRRDRDQDGPTDEGIRLDGRCYPLPRRTRLLVKKICETPDWSLPFHEAEEGLGKEKLTQEMAKAWQKEFNRAVSESRWTMSLAGETFTISKISENRRQ